MMISRVRTSVVVIHCGKVLCFEGVDPTSGRHYYFVPGGKIESHETAPEAAERETLEETGFSIAVDPLSAIEREYFFMWNGEEFDCLTIFYLGYLKSPLAQPVKDADYNKGVAWVSIENADEVFSYSREIQSAIKELIQKHLESSGK